MIALVPLLMLKPGIRMAPRIIAVALAAGPLVMINSATGFRRTDLAKVALARSYGASTLQIFIKIHFPMAMPMIIVGLMVGSIFGLLTAVGAEMVASSNGLGNRLNYFASLARMENFFGTIIGGCPRHIDLRDFLLHREEVRFMGGVSRESTCTRPKQTEVMTRDSG